jgi:Leucine-rich repeat (LRR) protein
MKKLLLILICLPFMTFAQQTYVPDDTFENTLINLGYDNVLDDYVATANINTVTSLGLYYWNIADLTGIEAFTALTALYIQGTQLTSLDVSSNTALTYLNCYNNQLTSIDISGATALTLLNIYDNQLTSLDVSQNTALTVLDCTVNQLTSLDVSSNTALIDLFCDDNQLTSLDVSTNTALTYFYCTDNQLTSLDLRNGNNTNMMGFDATDNPNLTCIDVNDPTWSTANSTNIDSQHYYSNNCGTTAIQEHTTNKELLKVTDLLGRETPYKKNTALFYIYDDGAVEKKIIIE